MAEQPKRRLRALKFWLAFYMVVAVVWLFKIQIIDHRKYAESAERQRMMSITMDQPPRGVIRDREGHLLAGNGVRYAIDASPNLVADHWEAAEKLASVLHMPAAHLEAQLSRQDPEGKYLDWVRITPSVSRDVGERVAELGIPGIDVRPLWERVYPEGSLASHALGFATAETGYYGVEGFYDAMLQPEPVRWEGPLDVDRVPIPWQPITGEFPRQGVNLELTLDRTVQMLVEQELARAVATHQAEAGTIIVMEPDTFGILGMASLPSYNPEDYARFADQDPTLFEDPAVSQQWEPGSVFKIVTVAAALDAGIVTPNTTYHDQGWIEVGGQAIHNAEGKAYGDVSVTDILVESLNVGAAWLSKSMGQELFYRYVGAFGFGQPTRVDLAGEVAGQVWLPEDVEHWHPSNLGTNAFGQGIAVTPVQMLTAVATVANDGARFQPHIVDRRITVEGTTSTFHPIMADRVIAPETARQISEMLVEALQESAPEARVEGYGVAGKTGTAQIPIPGGYDPEGTITTFIGFGPLPDPGLVVLVKLDRPQTSEWASKTAAPTFGRLMAQLFTVMGMPPGEGEMLVEAGP